jgi:hypothetical protein
MAEITAAITLARTDRDTARQLLALLTIGCRTLDRFEEERAYLFGIGIPARIPPGRPRARPRRPHLTPFRNLHRGPPGISHKWSDVRDPPGPRFVPDSPRDLLAKHLSKLSCFDRQF